MTVEKTTFCRICEPLCGLIATVDDGKLMSLRADKDNPHSKGFACAKGIAMTEVQNDPDRVTHPLKRCGGPGEFEQVSWDEALDDVARRLNGLRSTSGPNSIAIYTGNPPFFSHAYSVWGAEFQQKLGIRWHYGINAEDGASRVVASQLLYGMPCIPIPDYRRTNFLLILGANPWISRGSFFQDPRLREHFTDLVARGGRIVVVDPRRTETAARFEHVPIHAGTDAYLLLSVIHVLIAEHLFDETFVRTWIRGFDSIAAHAANYPPSQTEKITGIPPQVVCDIARGIAAAPNAVVYGRTGVCTQRFGTAVAALQDIVNALTGNVQVEGGWIFGWSPTSGGEASEADTGVTSGSVRSRVAGLPATYGRLPQSALPDDILTPGRDRIQALLMVGVNGVLSGPSGSELSTALEALDLLVSIDLYVNESNKYADYIFPTTTMYERPDIPAQTFGVMIRPNLQITDAIVPARGECRPEWQILEDLSNRMGLGRLIEGTPIELADTILGSIPVDPEAPLGEMWSWARMQAEAPHGIVLHELQPLVPLEHILRTSDGKIACDNPLLIEELERLGESAVVDADFPFRLIGMRESRSQNTWMHNVKSLMPDSRFHAMRMHSSDAVRLGIADGANAVVTSKTGRIVVRVSVTDEMMPGNVALPHGWGHEGGWRRANATGGANSNALASRWPEDLERLAAMTVLSGIPVRIEAERQAAAST